MVSSVHLVLSCGKYTKHLFRMPFTNILNSYLHDGTKWTLDTIMWPTIRATLHRVEPYCVTEYRCHYMWQHCYIVVSILGNTVWFHSITSLEPYHALSKHDHADIIRYHKWPRQRNIHKRATYCDKCTSRYMGNQSWPSVIHFIILHSLPKNQWMQRKENVR